MRHVGLLVYIDHTPHYVDEIGPRTTCRQQCSSWWRSHTPHCRPPIQSPERANRDGFHVRSDAYHDLLIFLNGILDLLPYSIFWAFQILPDTLHIEGELS